MKVSELAALIGAPCQAAEDAAMREVTCGYACDLLSWVMAHGQQGMAWVTVQTHMNVVAVAVLMEMACIILPEGIAPEDAMLAKAREEGIAILQSDLTAYEICGRMAAAGIAPSAR